MRKMVKIYVSLTCAVSFYANAQEIPQYQYWLELTSADQTYADRSEQIGRQEAFREFLGQGSIVFREGRGPVDGLEEYLSDTNPFEELTWGSHYIDVSRDGDLGLTAGPYELIDTNEESDQPDQFFFGHLVSVWRKRDGIWELMADVGVPMPGFLSLDVEPDFSDTQFVLDETAEPGRSSLEKNDLQSLIDADDLFGLSINFRGGERALLRYGLESTRVYLPGMAPGIGPEASAAYGAYLDGVANTSAIKLTYMGGFLSTSKEMGYTYGVMETDNSLNGNSFRLGYLRQWRFKDNDEWGIAVEAIRLF